MKYAGHAEEFGELSESLESFCLSMKVVVERRVCVVISRFRKNVMCRTWRCSGVSYTIAGYQARGSGPDCKQSCFV